MKKTRPTKPKKNPKVRGPSKKDKNAIAQALLNDTDLVGVIKSIDPDILKRSLSHVLNTSLDVDPTNQGPKRLIDQFLASTDVVYRFAPAPSGDLHIGHVVPLLFNLLFSQIGINYGRKTKVIVRIDDTDPDLLTNPAAYKGISIVDTIQTILGTTLDDAGIVCYKSSDFIDPIVNTVFDILRSDNRLFYPDLTPQSMIKKMRADKVPSSYRDCTVDQNMKVLGQLKSGVVDGVIRAKIDMRSDNGNLRDPVVIRFRNGVAWPTYDLVCPFLDLYDMRRFGSGDNPTLLAVRDCNYFDRYDQYAWIQKAIKDCGFLQIGKTDKSMYLTSMLTFSRVQVQDVLLSKRKIRALISDGVVSDWNDPRLFTIRGINNRGVPVVALVNFYWVNAIMSTSGKGGSVAQHVFWSLYDKLMARTSKPILNRLRGDTNDVSDSIYSVTVVTYNDIVPSGIDPTTSVMGTFQIDLDQIMSSNLMHFKKLGSLGIDINHINHPGVPAKLIYDQINTAFPDLFYYGFDLGVGDIVKINNFKGDDAQGHYPGYYVLRSIDRDSRKIVFSAVHK